MRFTLRQLLCTLLLTFGVGYSAFALPTEVSITPPDGARFLIGQKFDLRVEGKGTGPYSATIKIDGKTLDFTSGVQNSTTTDGITTAGWGGFNLRGYSNRRPGFHIIRATFTDASGSVEAISSFEILDPLSSYGLNASAQTARTTRAENNNVAEVEMSLDRASNNRKAIKNIIILIGDGMGQAHRTAARLVKHGVTAGRPNGYLAMEQFPGLGMVTTHSLNSIITDSAPGMSGYVSGNHNFNGQEGVYPAHVTNSFFYPRIEYLSEYLHRTLGKSTGIVSTAEVEDATPAANAIHTGNRGAGTGICDQYLDEADAQRRGNFGSGLQVLLGGGRRWFLPSTQFGSSRAAGSDYPALPNDLVSAWNLPVAGASDPGRDLLQDFKNAGFAYADNVPTLGDVMLNPPDKLLGLFAYGNMNTALDKLAKRRHIPLEGATSYVVDDYRAPDQPMLEEMTAAAIRVLRKNDKGFVLTVEAAHIDKQSHAMDADRAILETIEFDNAVEVARNFAEQNGETLVLVTADHECSGFSLIGALSGSVKTLQSLPADNIVLEADKQPERQKMIGVYDAAGFPQYKMNADGYPQTLDIDGKLLVGFGGSADRYETWLTKPLPIVDSLLTGSIQTELRGKGYADNPVDRASDKQTGMFLRGQAQGKSQAVHTASDVPIAAYSKRGAHQLFVGVQENTDVFFKIMRSVFGNY